MPALLPITALQFEDVLRYITQEYLGYNGSHLILQGGAVYVGATECPAGPLCPICMSCLIPWESREGWMMFGLGSLVGFLVLCMVLVGWESAARCGYTVRCGTFVDMLSIVCEQYGWHNRVLGFIRVLGICCCAVCLERNVHSCPPAVPVDSRGPVVAQPKGGGGVYPTIGATELGSIPLVSPHGLDVAAHNSTFKGAESGYPPGAPVAPPSYEEAQFSPIRGPGHPPVAEILEEGKKDVAEGGDTETAACQDSKDERSGGYPKSGGRKKRGLCDEERMASLVRSFQIEEPELSSGEDFLVNTAGNQTMLETRSPLFFGRGLARTPPMDGIFVEEQKFAWHSGTEVREEILFMLIVTSYFLHNLVLNPPTNWCCELFSHYCSSNIEVFGTEMCCLRGEEFLNRPQCHLYNPEKVLCITT